MISSSKKLACVLIQTIWLEHLEFLLVGSHFSLVLEFLLVSLSLESSLRIPVRNHRSRFLLKVMVIFPLAVLLKKAGV